MTHDRAPLLVLLLAPLACFATTLHAADGGGPAAGSTAGQVRFVIRDATRAQRVRARIHLQDATGKPVKASRLPFWHDHFVCAGEARVELLPGDYRFELERGPEYQAVAGFFLDWTRERMGGVNLPDAQQPVDVLKPWRDAEQFWIARLAEANAP